MTEQNRQISQKFPIGNFLTSKVMRGISLGYYHPTALHTEILTLPARVLRVTQSLMQQGVQGCLRP